MWQILGPLVFCALLSPVQGKVPAIRSAYSPEVSNNIMVAATEHGGTLLNVLKGGLVLPDIRTGVLLGLLGDILSLEIEEARLMHHTTRLSGTNGAEVTATVKMTFTGNSSLTASLIKITLDLTYLTKVEATNFSAGSYESLIRNCDIQFGDVDISLLGSSLLPSVISTIKKSITDSLGRQLCPLLSLLLAGMRDNLMLSVNVNTPFGSYGEVRFQLAGLPRTFADHAELDLSGDIEVLGKGVLSIPDDAPPTGPPPLQGYSHCHSLHPAFLNLLLSVVADRNPRSSAPAAAPGAAGLRGAVLPAVPPGSALSFDVSLLGGPALELANGQAVAQLPVRIDGLATHPNGSATPVLAVTDTIGLGLAISVPDGKLHVALSVASHDLEVVSAGAAATQVASLEPHLDSLLNGTLLPLLNEAFREGIQLPTAIGTSLANAHGWVAEGAIMICA